MHAIRLVLTVIADGAARTLIVVPAERWRRDRASAVGVSTGWGLAIDSASFLGSDSGIRS